jgi:hypothetical protein
VNKIGAVTVVPLTVIVIMVPARPAVVGNGNVASVYGFPEGGAALRFVPYTSNRAPCAMPELGRPGGRALPAFTTPENVGV